MLSLAEVQKMLSDRKVSVVSAATGLHRNTIAAVRDGKAGKPSEAVLMALSEYLNGSS